ncbi:MAG TPA: BON domain-containing protein [Longimicrobiales bacterium]|nr:BON domain-containing protein [Longimicrobiales bacterium]
MTEGFDDVFHVDDMDDEELAELIAQEFDESPDLDPDLIDIEVRNGRVRLMGRVGSEHELQVAESIVADVLGLTDFENDLVVDELVRGESNEAADIEVTDAAGAGIRADSPADLSSPEADHLMDDPKGDLYGASDTHQALSRGQTYEPPTRPIQDGIESRENH